MLSFLKVRDLALVEDVEVEFSRGFNALTGETGAGKTMLLGAVSLLLGGRAEAGWIRKGAKAAELSCIFSIEPGSYTEGALVESGYVEEGAGELILDRVLQPGGKNRCSINGRLCPVSALAQVGSLLLEVHGQDEHQVLTKAATHVDYLDRFAGPRHGELLSEYGSAYAALKAARSQRERVPSGAEAEREASLLASETGELEALSPREGEVEELEGTAAKLRAARDLITGASEARDLLSGGEGGRGARELLLEAADRFSRMSETDPSLSELAGRAETAAIEAEDLSDAARGYLEEFDSAGGTLEEIESRLSDLRSLARRYGSIEQALERGREASARLEELRSATEMAADLDSRIEALSSEVAQEAASISKSRTAAGKRLEKEVDRQLDDLELQGRFVVQITGRDGSPVPKGSDDVKFLFSIPGGEALPLSRIASGGEMSRVMLALKIVLAGADRIGVLFFDEVDSGIGGETAARVGMKLSELTGYHQVICVTHLPQIAVYADEQYLVRKVAEGDTQTTFIERLDSGGRLEEVCRMLGDSSGRKSTKAHARDMLQAAGARKKAVS